VRPGEPLAPRGASLLEAIRLTPTPAQSSPEMTIGPDGIGVVTFDDPDRSVNVLSRPALQRLQDLVRILQGAAETGELRGVIFRSRKESSFIVGADLDAISGIDDPNDGATAARFGQEVFLDIERLPVPTLAAIHGTCMGGGLELALACRYRVASEHPDTRLAFPEVLLGILPAWGGTTRLPRRIGLRAALDLILTGRTIDARQATRLGLVDRSLPHEGFASAARTMLEDAVAPGLADLARRRPLSTRWLEGTHLGQRILLAAARRQVLRKTGGHYPAPVRILDVVRKSLGKSEQQGFSLEAEAAGELLASEVSGHLVQVFRWREAARKARRVAGEREGHEVRGVGVVGAGIMGGGIAQLAAFHDIPVRLRDLRVESIAQALRHADNLFRSAAERGKLSPAEATRRRELISGGTSAPGFRPLDVVIEAVVERLDVKRAVLAALEDEVSESCVLATNTSSLSVDSLARTLQHPERFLGLHFFNPVHRMPLVEVVRGEATGDIAVGVACRLALKLGKIPVVVRDGPGFLVNRILGPYLNEAGFLLADGWSVEEIDGTARTFGMPMGPLRLLDEIGIDVVRHAGEALHEGLGERMAPSPPLRALGSSGRIGRKGGEGVYRYREGKERGVADEVYALMNLPRPRKGNRIGSDKIRERLLLAMINEAARILEDRITDSAAAIDLAMVLGTGFPPFRGGLLRMADEHHLRAIRHDLEMHERNGLSRFTPAPLLVRLAEADRKFHDAFRHPD